MVAWTCAMALWQGVIFRAVGDAPQADLRSLPPNQVLSRLDLERPELAAVREAHDRHERLDALTALLAYYRQRHPLPERAPSLSEDVRQEADQVVEHIFQWGPYEPAAYGPDVNWEWDPRGDIEWVAAVYRFYWAPPLATAYAATREEKYANAFVELASDWIVKHPLEARDRAHYVYTRWRGFPWLDIQTGIRASNLCRVFPLLVHAEAFTPEFLEIFLASLYDHQMKTERFPMNQVHNKAIFEQRGFAAVAHTFPEFRDAPRWMGLALERTCENLLAQTTSDGVQREWAGGYHSGVLRDAVEIMGWAQERGFAVPEAMRERVRRMFDYVFAMATPELGYPMFGDCGRDFDARPDRSRWQLYGMLERGTALFGDPKYAARARLDLEALPAQTSYAFQEAGMYVMRDQWGPEQVYLALHCSPPAISSHDQPDNGTFELYAFGRWLLTDSGYYTYGHDPESRAWHRRTAVHQTLTLNGEDAQVAGKHLLWHGAEGFDALIVENASYAGLIHRRSVWFVDRSFFVILDEAIGDAPGVLDLHYQFAPGEVRLDQEQKCATTAFKDANVLVWMGPAAPVTLEEQPGWFAWSYGKRMPRTAIRFRHRDSAPASFLTVLVPYRGAAPPEVSASLSEGFRVGPSRVTIEVSVAGRRWALERDLSEGHALATPASS